MMSEKLDIPAAVAFLMETAIEMYLEEGHTQAEAEILAKELLESPVEFYPTLTKSR
jgi:hypothetical protein